MTHGSWCSCVNCLGSAAVRWADQNAQNAFNIYVAPSYVPPPPPREMTAGDLGLDKPDAPYAFWLGRDVTGVSWRKAAVERLDQLADPPFTGIDRSPVHWWRNVYTNPLDGTRLWDNS